MEGAEHWGLEGTWRAGCVGGSIWRWYERHSREKREETLGHEIAVLKAVSELDL